MYIVYVLGTAGMHQVIDTNGSYEPGPGHPHRLLGFRASGFRAFFGSAPWFIGFIGLQGLGPFLAQHPGL